MKTQSPAGVSDPERFEAERVIADHSDMMRRFGYLDEDGKPV